MCALQAVAGCEDSGGCGRGQTQAAEAAPTALGSAGNDADNGNMHKQARHAECNSAELAEAGDGARLLCALLCDLPAFQAHYHDIRSAGRGGAQLRRQVQNGGRRAGRAGLRGAIGHRHTMQGGHPGENKAREARRGCAGWVQLRPCVG